MCIRDSLSSFYVEDGSSFCGGFHNFILLSLGTNLWIGKLLQILKVLLWMKLFQCRWIWWGDGVMQVHIRAKAAKNHSQLFIETHYSLQSIEGMSFFWWQPWFRFSFLFQHTWSLRSSIQNSSLKLAIRLVQMYPVLLCLSPSLLPIHSPFLLPQPCSKAS